MIHPEDRERVQADFMDVVDAGRSAQSEFRILRPDGEIRWCKVTGTTVPNPYGVVERMVLRPKTSPIEYKPRMSWKRQRLPLVQRVKAKNEFLSRMSHEVRTPLNAVLGFGQLLEHRLHGTDHAESARHIVRGGRHLLSLID